MVAIYSTLREDLYVVFAEKSGDTSAGHSRIFKSAGEVIWLGGLVVVWHAGYAVPNRRAVLVCCRARRAGQQPRAAWRPRRLGKGMIKRRVVAVSLLIAISASSAALFLRERSATNRSRQAIGGKFMCMCSCNQC